MNRRAFLAALGTVGAAGCVTRYTTVELPFESSRGGVLFVDPHVGNDSNKGIGWYAPLATMAEAFKRSQPGGVIQFYGKVREEGLVTPQGLTDMTILGAATRPRGGNIGNAAGPKRGAANWSRLRPEDDKPLLTVTQQGWSFKGIQFQGPVNGAAVHLIRDLAGENEPTGKAGDHASFEQCAFVGPNLTGLLHEGGINNVSVKECTFYGFSGEGQVAIRGIAPVVGYPLMWDIRDNRFIGNWAHIQGALGDSRITNNFFTTKSIVAYGMKPSERMIDLAGAGRNMIYLNRFDCTMEESKEFFIKAAEDAWGINIYKGGVIVG